MQDAARQTRTDLMRVFKRGRFHPRGDLGQNFLIDLNLMGYMVEQAELGPGDVVLEVGTGTGGLTARLAEQAAHVISVEIDRNVHGVARELLAGLPNITLVHGDALKDKNHFAPELLEAARARLASVAGSRLKLVANLPYCVATPVLSNLLAGDLPWQMALVTIQWELAQRLRARPGQEDYGSLTVWVQSQCRVSVLKKLGPAVFWPRPAVDSAIVRIVPDANLRAGIEDRAFLHMFARGLFRQRRKLLRGVLVSLYGPKLARTEIDRLLEPFGLPANARAEQLDVGMLVQVANALRGAFPQD
jgi:16S rRNA (adenine1518-N6/adenine1519-N6)-dimethyltransferase